jgi:hypothetical protein
LFVITSLSTLDKCSARDRVTANIYGTEPGTKANQSKGWDAKLQGFALEDVLEGMLVGPLRVEHDR